jgi:hypothetical protein
MDTGTDFLDLIASGHWPMRDTANKHQTWSSIGPFAGFFSPGFSKATFLFLVLERCHRVFRWVAWS